MKRKIMILLLCALLLGGTASAANAGGADDPLISRSYVTDTFLPHVKAALAAAADGVLAARAAERAPSARILPLSAGQSVLLTEGQQFTLLSGTANVYTEVGELVNLTAGDVAGNGAVAIRSRYLVCEDARTYVDVTADAVLKVSYAAETGTGSPFTDVTRADWFYSDVVSAVGRGLVNGMTPDTYVPGGTLTGAQCVKLAACMHQLCRENAVTLENSPEGTDWYRSFADYALENSILDAEMEDYDSPVSRRQFVGIFYRAMPRRAYTQIDAIPDGAIPDVAESDEGGAQVYAFYRAGILTGYTNTPGYDEHAFGPESTITRAEVATIMNRMFDETARVRFTIG